MSPESGTERKRYSPEGISDLRGKKVVILTFGCAYNHGDTRNLEGVLVGQGCTIIDSLPEAEAVVVNTCTVVGSTERKMLRVLRECRNTPLYVTGCMPSVQRQEILAVCDPVFFSPPDIAAAWREMRTVIPHEVGIVHLGRGCPGSCTYCITRMAQGSLVSYPEEEILGCIMDYACSGSAEIRLTAQDCSAWGQDCESALPSLIEKIGDLPGKFRIRLGMMNPATILPILDTLPGSFRYRNIFQFAHIPIQSGSDRILRAMGRGYTADDVIEIVRTFRRFLPDITLATDVIAGFPGEDEGDLAATCDLLDAMMPSKINITRYSRRPHTPAVGMKDHPDRIKKVRSRILQRHAEAIYRHLNSPLLGTSVNVLVTERIKPGTVLARTDSYTGVVLRQDFPVGTELNANIVEDKTYFFIGDVVC
ncbi:MAG: radical SAM protein [Methanoregulaceae archaeon]|nr:radical SAM protein [Methanoregulaceae archaeon]